MSDLSRQLLVEWPLSSACIWQVDGSRQEKQVFRHCYKPRAINFSLPMVTHKKAATYRVNHWTFRWYPNKDTRPRFARLFGPISDKNLMWRHAAHFTIRLRSSCCSLLQLSTCFVPRCIRLASCHNYRMLLSYSSYSIFVCHSCSISLFIAPLVQFTD